MIPTFSVNKGQEKIYSQAMVNLISQMEQGKTYTAEALSTIVDKILDDDVEVEDVTAYSKEVNKMIQLKRTTEKEQPIIISSLDILKGYSGVVLAEFDDKTADISTIDSIVQEFIDIREKLYYADGIDIFYLVDLSLQDDKKAQVKLKKVMYEHKELKNLIVETLETPGVLTKLYDILA